MAEEHIEGHYRVDPSLFKPSADFLLRVNGMSMKDIGILDGDLLAVHRTTDVHNGQVVVPSLSADPNGVTILPINDQEQWAQHQRYVGV